MFEPKKQTSKTQMYQLRMTPEMFAQVKAAAKKLKMDKSELIRQMVACGLADLDRLAKKS